MCLAEFFLLKIILKNPGGGGFKYFLFSPPYLGKISNLTSISFRWVGSTTQLGIHGKNLHLFGWPGSTFPLKKTQPKTTQGVQQDFLHRHRVREVPKVWPITVGGPDGEDEAWMLIFDGPCF